MEIQWSRYQLNPRRALNSLTGPTPREGCLIRVRDGLGNFGYADLHPWPELGDTRLDEQLLQLKQGLKSSQIEQAIAMALRDADCRRQKKSFLDFGEPLKNNFLISDLGQINDNLFTQLQNEKFSTVKLKVGRNQSLDFESVNHTAAAGFRIRLDYNGCSSPVALENFFSKLSADVLAQIEYVEDPFPYSEKAWARISDIVPLALDNEFCRVPWEQLNSSAFDVLIIKPAKLNPLKAIELCQKWKLKFAVTSYLDHPVGVIHAYDWALRLYKDYGSMALDPGCLTVNHYESNSFAAAIETSGPFILKNSGFGCGFDHLFEGLSWTS
jgi:O-succinylbenzoate synthase